MTSSWAEIFFFLVFKFNLFFFIQQVLISHPFYTHQCIHVNPNLPIHHTIFFKKFYLFLAASGLSCGMWDLR